MALAHPTERSKVDVKLGAFSGAGGGLSPGAMKRRGGVFNDAQRTACVNIRDRNIEASYVDGVSDSCECFKCLMDDAEFWRARLSYTKKPLVFIIKAPA